MRMRSAAIVRPRMTLNADRILSRMPASARASLCTSAGSVRARSLSTREDARGQVAHRLVHGALVEARDRLRREGGIVVAGRQRLVQLGGAAAQQPGELDVGAEGLGDQRGRLLARQVEQGMIGDLDADALLVLREGAVEVAPYLLPGVAPGVPWLGTN